MVPSRLPIDAARSAEPWLAAARAGSPAAQAHVLEVCRQYLQLMVEHVLDTELVTALGPSQFVEQCCQDVQRTLVSFHGAAEPELVGWLCRVLLRRLNHFQRVPECTAKLAVEGEVPFDPASFVCTWHQNLFPDAPPLD
jgi:hypothetical protein